jgi:hypothetical protein
MLRTLRKMHKTRGSIAQNDKRGRITIRPRSGWRGAPGGIRTPDHQIRSLPLCPLSYRRATTSEIIAQSNPKVKSGHA